LTRRLIMDLVRIVIPKNQYSMLFRKTWRASLMNRIGGARPRRTPVGYGRVDEQFWLIAEHGRKAGYVRNIEQNPRVRIKLRDGFRARWHTGTAHLLPDDDPRERQRWLAAQLPSSTRNAAAVRLFGTELLTVRIDLESLLSRSKNGAWMQFNLSLSPFNQAHGLHTGLA